MSPFILDLYLILLYSMRRGSTIFTDPFTKKPSSVLLRINICYTGCQACQREAHNTTCSRLKISYRAPLLLVLRYVVGRYVVGKYVVRRYVVRRYVVRRYVNVGKHVRWEMPKKVQIFRGGQCYYDKRSCNFKTKQRLFSHLFSS